MVCLFSASGDEGVVDLVLHVQAVGADAGLAGVAVLADHRALDGAVDVGVVEDDEGRVAAQFEAELLIVGRTLRARMRPTSVEPVNDRWRTTSLAHSTLPTAIELAPSPVTMFSTPAGMPARCASSATASADSGVCSAGLITTGQPAASAGATLRVIIAIGKFHGVMARTRRSACLMTR